MHEKPILMRKNKGGGRFGCSHPVGESSRLVGSRRWRGGRARFLHFELAKLEGQGDPLLGESFEFLVVGELLAHLRNKLRTNKLGGALAEVGVTELVEGAMFLGPSGYLVDDGARSRPPQ